MRLSALVYVLLGAGALVAAAEPKQPAALDQHRSAPAAQRHWAFRPVGDPTPPDVVDASVVRTPIDRFILARLEEHGLRFSPPADRRTLIRRATFDLLGLPPTYEQVEQFVNDSRPDAFARLVDRLLASPRYGERWGRYWLDIARYADTKGYVFAAETRYPFSYTYRDYVIRAFNEDLPYDRFILEQLAADQLQRRDDRALAGLGFITVGRRFRNNRHDIIDDRIDVVTRGLMGLTVRCARCHDHKYDPIPTEDYYSLYGVFDSTYEPDDLPLLAEPAKTEGYLAYKKELDKRQKALDEFIDGKYQELLEELRSRVTDYLLKVVEDRGEVSDEFALSFSKGEPRPQIVRRWRLYLRGAAGKDHPVFAPWHALASLPADQFAEKAVAVIDRYAKRTQGDAHSSAGKPVNPLVVEALLRAQPKSMYDVARAYGRLLTEIDAQQPDRAGEKPEIEQLRQVLYGARSPIALTRDEAQKIFDRQARNKLRELDKQIEQWKVNSPDAPPRAMVVYDKRQPVTPHVLVRGNPNRRGQAVPRRFLRVLTGPNAPAFQQGSGRLELARKIADPQNPLTARVLVNRVWMHHFGRGLVEPPSDFGTRTDPPTHPKLLDYLASRFIEDGWSIKSLHRRIMLSAVYQQSSRAPDASLDPDPARVDPENRLLWRMNRRRLDFEAMRDSLLAVSGRLDETMGGKPVDLEKRPFSRRRTVYGFVNRNNLPSLFRIFDFANPDASTGKRPTTTIPQQALYGLNSPFVIEQARWLAAHPEVTGQSSPAGKIRALYRRVFARDPLEQEVAWAEQYIGSQKGKGNDSHADENSLNPWERYAQALLLTNEFLFVD